LPGETTLDLKPQKPLHRVRKLLQNSYDAPLTVEDLSREAALSPFHLIRTFRNVYKQTPHQYLVELRIAKAKELLRNTDISITEICAEVGYESLGSFSTLFSKLAGISPSAYRASSRPSATPGYIPYCVCLMHGIEERPNPSK
jgi:AraC-like DNA-binding protein